MVAGFIYIKGLEFMPIVKVTSKGNGCMGVQFAAVGLAVNDIKFFKPTTSA